MNDLPDPPAGPFADLDAYVALPRVSGLSLSPDGTRLVTTLSTLDAKSTRYVGALWEVDPAGGRPARRLTRSTQGESGAAWLPDGSLLFCSARPDPDTEAGEGDEVPMLWSLPADGGEAAVVATRPGGVGGVRVARDAGTVLLASDTFPSSTDEESEAATRKQRKEHKVSAILHERSPVRFWDHDLGPAVPRLFTGALGAGSGPGDETVVLHDLTPAPGAALASATFDVTPDGAIVVTGWNVTERGGLRECVAVLDVATGERRMLLDEPGYEYAAPRISPDGTRVACLRETRPTPHEPPDVDLVVVALSGGEAAVVTEGWDRWPAGQHQWLPDGSGLVVVADEDGRAPVFRIGLDAEVTRLTGDDFAYAEVQVAPDGRTAYALRSSYAEPHRVVRLSLAATDQDSVPLQGPVETPALPGRLEEVETTGEDGSRVRSWLALPDGAGPEAPAPLLLWIHGGPLGSWNSWSWRWNPWVAVAQGYAVLLPDPALSTGYGRGFIARGWGAWGAAPYTDLMAATDAALTREDLDASRTAAMGGSFGGYMANWVAGHTDRFRAIVTHASLWALEGFGPTTDAPWYWRLEMTPEMTEASSPHRFVDDIVTPMLLIHGDKDYRVPIGEGLRLWSELAARAEAEDGEMEHKFLYFPDENHWVLTPQHAKVWYATVLAFCDHHVRDQAWTTPELLS